LANSSAPTGLLRIAIFIGVGVLPFQNIPFSRFAGVYSLAQTAFVLEIHQWKSTRKDDGEGVVLDTEVERCGHGSGRVFIFPSKGLAMRNVFMSTLSQVVEIGIFAAAAGALAVGMLSVR
jgi:hypothetical protein